MIIIRRTRIKNMKKATPKLPSPKTAAPHSVLDLMHGKVLHIDQSIGRCNNNGKLSCLTRGSTIFLYGPDIVLPGSLHPVLARFSTHLDRSFIATKHKRCKGTKMTTSSKAKEIIGESYCASAAATAHAALLLVRSFPWWQ